MPRWSVDCSCHQRCACLGDLNWWLPARLKRFGSRLHLPETASLPFLLMTLAVVAALVVGCSPTGQLLANPLPATPLIPATAPIPSHAPDPQPISLPRDEAPHDRLTEWWYYTGHLATSTGREFGFEFVIFRAERGSFPVSWASHLALDRRAGQPVRCTTSARRSGRRYPWVRVPASRSRSAGRAIKECPISALRRG